jgi:hypothetical protein
MSGQLYPIVLFAVVLLFECHFAIYQFAYDVPILHDQKEGIMNLLIDKI